MGTRQGSSPSPAPGTSPLTGSETVALPLDLRAIAMTSLPGRIPFPSRFRYRFRKQVLDVSVDAAQLIGGPFLQCGVELGVDSEEEGLALGH